jgi:hypothetical protein
LLLRVDDIVSGVSKKKEGAHPVGQLDAQAMDADDVGER